MQMYYYMEALVNNTDLTFDSEMLKQMFELFFDLMVIFVNIQEPLSNQSGHYRPQSTNVITPICNHMLASDLINKLELGLNSLDQADQGEIRERYNQTLLHVNSVRQQLTQSNYSVLTY